MDDVEWVKSSRSASNGNCVEVAFDGPDLILVRDSKDPAGSRLTFTRSEWDAFVGGCKDGDFDDRYPIG